MNLVFYALYSFASRKMITPIDFYDWLFLAPGHKSAWLIFFSFMAGFFVAMFATMQEPILLYPAGCCLIAISVFGLSVMRPAKEVIEKLVPLEKVVEKKVFVQPDSNCGVVYIMRRSDGILKFGKARRLEDRLKAHQKDYQTDFNVVSSWIVPNMDRFEAIALSLTSRYFHQEAQRRELRLMSDSQLTQFILEFTDRVHKGWTQ